MYLFAGMSSVFLSISLIISLPRHTFLSYRDSPVRLAKSIRATTRKNVTEMESVKRTHAVAILDMRVMHVIS